MKRFKFNDPDLPIPERVADLIGHMTVEEKCLELLHKAPGVERIGSGAVRAGMGGCEKQRAGDEKRSPAMPAVGSSLRRLVFAWHRASMRRLPKSGG